MWSKILKIAIRIFTNKFPTKSIGLSSVSGAMKELRFMKLFKTKLSPLQRDYLRNLLWQNKSAIRYRQAIEPNIANSLDRLMNNQALSMSEKNNVNFYQELFVKETKEDFDKPNSSWILQLRYEPQAKVCWILMKSDSGYTEWYPFFNVPKTKYLWLKLNGGKYMWDYFGKHYSLFPSRWVRKGETYYRNATRIKQRRERAKKYYGK